MSKEDKERLRSGEAKSTSEDVDADTKDGKKEKLDSGDRKSTSSGETNKDTIDKKKMADYQIPTPANEGNTIQPTLNTHLKPTRNMNTPLKTTAQRLPQRILTTRITNVLRKPLHPILPPTIQSLTSKSYSKPKPTITIMKKRSKIIPNRTPRN